MPTTITDTLISWASDLDPDARDGALRASRPPILAGPIALMPDAHWGIGATVGSGHRHRACCLALRRRGRHRLRHDRG
jgi:hypothetical protein